MKVLVLVFLAALTSATRAYRPSTADQAAAQFEEFITTFNKHYADEQEKTLRFEIFKKNLQLINQKNLESNGSVYGITKFSDLSTKEFLERHTGYIGTMLRDGSSCQIGTAKSKSAPDSFSWKDQGVISKPKDQNLCGSCWAFSAIGNVEAHYAIKHKDLLDLSEQQVIDCDKKSNGCGGTTNIEFPFVYLNGSGSMLENDYPYIDKNGQCNFKPSEVKVKVTNCVTYRPKTEEELKNILHSAGPVTIAVDAIPMQQYTNGILPECPMIELNHAVLIVGYGSENGTDFWLIKNSWGLSFGEEGYIRIKRGVNACGLMASIAVEAVVD